MANSARDATDRLWKDKALTARESITWSDALADNVDTYICKEDYKGAIALANFYTANRVESQLHSVIDTLILNEEFAKALSLIERHIQ